MSNKSINPDNNIKEDSNNNSNHNSNNKLEHIELSLSEIKELENNQTKVLRILNKENNYDNKDNDQNICIIKKFNKEHKNNKDKELDEGEEDEEVEVVNVFDPDYDIILKANKFTYCGMIDENLMRNHLGINFYYSNEDMNENKIKRVYYGAWSENKKEGKGFLLEANLTHESSLNSNNTGSNIYDNLYFGEWKDNKRNGKGILITSINSKYLDISDFSKATYKAYIGEFEEDNFKKGLLITKDVKETNNNDSNSATKDEFLIYYGSFSSLQSKLSTENGLLYINETNSMFLGKIEDNKAIKGDIVQLNPDNYLLPFKKHFAYDINDKVNPLKEMTNPEQKAFVIGDNDSESNANNDEDSNAQSNVDDESLIRKVANKFSSVIEDKDYFYLYSKKEDKGTDIFKNKDVFSICHCLFTSVTNFVSESESKIRDSIKENEVLNLNTTFYFDYTSCFNEIIDKVLVKSEIEDLFI